MQQAPFAGANGSIDRNDLRWVRLDGDEQRVVDHRDLWSAGHDQWSGQFHGGAEHGDVAAASARLTIARPAVRGDAGRPTPAATLLTPANRTIGGEGGTGSITVGTASGCPWTATSNQSWISVSGTGTVVRVGELHGVGQYDWDIPGRNDQHRDEVLHDYAGRPHRECERTGGARDALVTPSGVRVKVTGSE